MFPRRITLVRGGSRRAEKGSKERRIFRRVKSILYIEIVGLGAAGARYGAMRQ